MASSLQKLSAFITRGTYAIDAKIGNALRYMLSRGAADNVVYNPSAVNSVGSVLLTAVPSYVITNACGFNSDFAVVGGRSYRFRAYIPCLADNTSGVKVDWLGGSCTYSAFQATGFNYVNSTLTILTTASTTAPTTTSQTGVTNLIVVEGTFTASGSGSFGMRAAVTTGSAVTSFLAGGFVSLTEMAIGETP